MVRFRHCWCILLLLPSGLRVAVAEPLQVGSGEETSAGAPQTDAARPEERSGPAAGEVRPTGGPDFHSRVTAHRAPLTAGATEIEAAQIRQALPGSGSEALELVPGLRVVQHGAEGKGHQLFLRGFDAVHGADVEVRLAGLPQNERVQVHGLGYVDLYHLVPEAIRRMRVEPGPFLPWQGDFATAGSVEFELGLAAADRPGLVRLEGNEHGRVRGVAVVSPRDAPEEALLAAEAVHDSGFGPAREARRGSLIAAWAWPLGRRAELIARATLQTARWESPGAFRFASYQQGRDFHDAYTPAGLGESDRGLVQLLLRHDRANREVELAVAGMLRRLVLEDNYTGWLMHPDQGDRQRQEQAGWTLGASVKGEQRLGLRLPLTLLGGLGWRGEQAELDVTQVGGAGQGWQTTRDQQAWAHELYAYAGLRWKPWDRLQLLPSVRGELLRLGVDDHRQAAAGSQGFGVLLPRFTLALQVAEPLTLLAAVGRGFRSPEARAVLAPPPGSVEDANLSQYTGGSPAITVADAAEAGLEFQPFSWLNLRCTGFFTHIERELIFDHVSNTTVEQDGTHRLGGELALKLEPLAWASLQADVSRIAAHFVRSGHPVPGTAPWAGRGSLRLGRPRGPHGTTELTWSSTRALAHGATASGETRLELAVGWRWTRFDLTLAVDNVTDEPIMDGAYHYASWFERTTPRSGLPVIHYTAAPPRTARLLLTGYL